MFYILRKYVWRIVNVNRWWLNEIGYVLFCFLIFVFVFVIGVLVEIWLLLFDILFWSLILFGIVFIVDEEIGLLVVGLLLFCFVIDKILM